MFLQLNSRFVLFLLCVTVNVGVAFASATDIHDILDSAVLNVAMFAMGLVATRCTMKDSFEYFDALVAYLPPITPVKALISQAAVQAANIASSVDDASLATPWLSPETQHVAPLLAGLSSLLASRVTSADVSGRRPFHKSCFHSTQPLDVDIVAFVSHIYPLFECSSPCLVIALIFFERVLTADTNLALGTAACGRLFLTSLLVAVKMHDEDELPFPNDYYAGVGEIEMDDLNNMEKHFCKLIGWRFHVTPEDYLRCHNLIVAAAPIQHQNRQAWKQQFLLL